MLSDMQSDAVKDIAGWFADNGSGIRDWEFWESSTGLAPTYYLAGYAGTGKTTLVPTAVEAMGLEPNEVTFLAPTGKAAKILTEKLRAFGINRSAKTIHSGIYRPRQARAEKLQEELDGLKAKREELIEAAHEEYAELPTEDRQSVTHHPAVVEIDERIAIVQKTWDQAVLENEGPKFQLNPDSRIRESRLIVVDEASMVGAAIANDLRYFGVPILAVGDPFQLPPVEDKPGLTAGKPDFFLTEIHRQARDNPIIALAHRVRQCEILNPQRLGDKCRVVTKRGDEWTLNPDYEAQVIVGRNVKRWELTREIRTMCGYTSTGPCNGEPMLICRNSYKIPEFVNGTFVTCVEDVGELEKGWARFIIKVRDEFGEEREIEAVQAILEEHYLGKGVFTGQKPEVFNARRFCEHVDWGWVITGHKSQGSQWPNVVVHDESTVFARKGEDPEIPFRWLYTAITRASEELTIVI